jgi:uncharacterized membrane protein YbhN (UPF0104 family)
MKNKWRHRALWLVTLGILAYLFATIPIAKVWDSLMGAAPWTIPVLAVGALVVYVADSFAVYKTLSWFAAPLTFREALVVRGAAYPLGMVNYAVGQGAFAYFLHERKNVPLARSGATTLLIMGINLVLLLLMASFGLAVSGPISPNLAPQLRITQLLIVLGYIGLFGYLMIIRLRPRVVAERPVFEVLLEAGLSGHLKALVARVPHILALVLYAHLYLVAFDVRVPPLQLLLFLPVAFLVAALPLPGQGLGTAQLITVAIFAPFGPGSPDEREAAVLAASLTGHSVALAVTMIVGIACLRSHLGHELVMAKATETGEAQKEPMG